MNGAYIGIFVAIVMGAFAFVWLQKRKKSE
jgi:hypothetical protein